MEALKEFTKNWLAPELEKYDYVIAFMEECANRGQHYLIDRTADGLQYTIFSNFLPVMKSGGFFANCEELMSRMEADMYISDAVGKLKAPHVKNARLVKRIMNSQSPTAETQTTHHAPDQA
jgi:hypothetical protein